MEKKSCCCAGEAETVNINMETTGVTGAEATANTVTAETETPSDDAVCHCRHKHRTEKEEKDLLTRLNRIEGQVRHQSYGSGRTLLPGYPGSGICRPVCLKRLLQSSLIQPHQNLRGGRYQERKRGDRCSGTLRDDQEDDVEMGGNSEI